MSGKMLKAKPHPDYPIDKTILQFLNSSIDFFRFFPNLEYQSPI
jgi:hypothetical protein